MQKTGKDLARIINEKSHHHLKVKDVEQTLALLEETVQEELLRGNEVKIRSMAKFSLVDHEASRRYDGIRKTWYDKPAYVSATVKPLKMISDTNLRLEQQSQDN